MFGTKTLKGVSTLHRPLRNFERGDAPAACRRVPARAARPSCVCTQSRSGDGGTTTRFNENIIMRYHYAYH